jgi:hypothetical protein
MIRTCDGTDPNLTREARPGEEPFGLWPDSVPCDCGLTFDDVERTVIWPHTRIPTCEERDRKLLKCADALGPEDADLADWLRRLVP